MSGSNIDSGTESEIETSHDMAHESYASVDGIQEELEASASANMRKHGAGSSTSSISERMSGGASMAPATVTSLVAPTITDRSSSHAAHATAEIYSQTFEGESQMYSTAFEIESAVASRSVIHSVESTVMESMQDIHNITSASVMESIQEAQQATTGRDVSEVYSEDFHEAGASTAHISAVRSAHMADESSQVG